MRKKVIHEDDVLCVVSQYLNSINFQVLALGANQAGSFRFRIGPKKTKAPDLVAFRNGNILVFEAKVRSANLFSKANEGFSDYECISFLINSKSAQEEIIENAKRLLNLLKIEGPNDINVVGGLIAGDDFSNQLHRMKEKELILVSADVDTEKVIVIQDTEKILDFPKTI